MDFLENLLLDPSNITFSILFVGLFLYTLKKNDEREKRYMDKQETIIKEVKELKLMATDKRIDP